MTASPPPNDGATPQSDTLQQSVLWMMITVFLLTVVELVPAAISRSLPLAWSGGSTLLLALLLLLAFWQAGHGRSNLVAILICIGMSVLVVVHVLMVPGVVPIAVLLPVMAILLVIPLVSRSALRNLLIISWLVIMVVGLLAYMRTSATVQESMQVKQLIVLALALVAALTLMLLWRSYEHLHDALAQVREAKQALQDVQVQMGEQVVERTAALQQALSEVEARAREQSLLLEENERQRTTIRDLSVPVLPISTSTLIMPLVGELDSTRLDLIQEQALYAIEHSTASWLLLDITGVPVVDSDVAQGLVMVVESSRLLGAETILVGIRPEVAHALVGLGVELKGMRTFSDLQSALSDVMFTS